MAFSSGASSKRRKALQAAAAQYYEAFSKLTEVANPKRVDTGTAEDLESVTNDQASFRVRKMAKDSDRLARQFNRDDSFQSKADAYNDRYAILKEQMANRGAVRYSLSPNRVAPTSAATGPAKGSVSFTGAAGPVTQSNQAPSMATIAVGSPVQLGARYDPSRRYVTSRDELLAEAQSKADAYNASMQKTADPGLAQRIVPATADDFIEESIFQPFGALYRNLRVAEDAAADFNRLGAAVSSSSGGQALEKYAAITAKLKPLVEKEASRSALNASPTGLIADQLAAELDTGVLK